ncbi:MAG: hypothetical protein ACYCOU_14515, partial [Sulfobacillus sp.]
MKDTLGLAGSTSAPPLAAKMSNAGARWWLAGATLAGLAVVTVMINLRSPVPDSVLGLDVSPSRFLGDIFQTWTPTDLGQRVNGSGMAY